MEMRSYSAQSRGDCFSVGFFPAKTLSEFFCETFSYRPRSRSGRQRRPSVTVQWICLVYGVVCSVCAVLTALETPKLTADFGSTSVDSDPRPQSRCINVIFGNLWHLCGEVPRVRFTATPSKRAIVMGTLLQGEHPGARGPFLG